MPTHWFEDFSSVAGLNLRRIAIAVYAISVRPIAMHA